MRCLLFVLFVLAVVSTGVYFQIVGRTIGNKTQTEFPVIGPVQLFPNYTPGYQASFTGKITREVDYFSRQLGMYAGLIGAPGNSTFRTATITFSDGSINYSGTTDVSNSSQIVFSITSGTGRYLGSFGTASVSVANVTDGGTSITALFVIKLYTY